MENGLDKEQKKVFSSLVGLGSLIESQLQLLLDSMSGKINDAREIEEDASIAKSRSRDIESECLRTILRYHPVASDLRVISASTRISTDLERIGDNASDIHEIFPFITYKTYFTKLSLVEMAKDVKTMVSLSVDAFVSRDIEKAEMVITSDDKVDAFFDSAKGKIASIIKNGEDYSEEALDLLMIAKYLERMADHAVSIARYVGWSVDGDEDWLGSKERK